MGFLIAFAGGLVVVAIAARPRAHWTPAPVRSPSAQVHPAAAVAGPSSAAPAPEPPLTLESVVLQAASDLERLGALAPEQREREIRGWAVIGVPRYALLERGGERFLGERVMYRGRVEEVREVGPDATALRVSVDPQREQVLWVQTIERAPDWIERGSRVLVSGYVVGENTYESQAGLVITLPAVVAVGILRERR